MTESKLGTAPTVSTMGAAESIWPPAVFARGFWSLAGVRVVGWLVGVVGREDIEKKPWSPSLRGSNERLRSTKPEFADLDKMAQIRFLL